MPVWARERRCRIHGCAGEKSNRRRHDEPPRQPYGTAFLSASVLSKTSGA